MSHGWGASFRRRGRSARKRRISGLWCDGLGPSAILVVATVATLTTLLHAVRFVQSSRSDVSMANLRDGLDCEDFGCPLYPLDIESDMTVNVSLSQLQSFPKRPLTVPFATENAAVLTRKGNEGHPNQDRAFIIEPFITKQTPAGSRSFLLAILDGHGRLGHYVSDYLRTAIPQRLADKLNEAPCCQSDQWIQRVLNETFVEVDQEGSPTLLRGGSTASITLRIGSKLYFANCGDSQTVLARQGRSSDEAAAATIIYQTRRDKAHLPEERRRIERMGGTIFTPKQFPTQSRVIVYSVASIPHEPIGLAMSRSIGDWEWKLYGVTAEPIVQVVALNELRTTNSDESTFFIIAASDGVWDMRPRREFFVELLGRKIVADTEPLWKSCIDTMWAVAPSKPSWYRDDMTLIAMKILLSD